jgi:RimJ/RimL family protein N-acetyltransferase
LPAQTPEITARQVACPADAEAMRVLRNHCRRWMTRDRRLISPTKQQEWWANRPPALCAYLYFVSAEAVAFGLLRHEKDRWWATLGVRRSWRSRGIGTWIYRHLIGTTPGRLWIEIDVGNTASLKAAARAGFILVSTSRDLHLLVATGEP